MRKITLFIACVFILLQAINAQQTGKDQVPREFVAVEGGTYVMGLNKDNTGEFIHHSVTLSDFEISKYEITNAQYAAFLNHYGDVMVKDGEYAGKY